MILRHTTMQPYPDRNTSGRKSEFLSRRETEEIALFIGGATMAKKVEGYIKLKLRQRPRLVLHLDSMGLTL